MGKQLSAEIPDIITIDGCEYTVQHKEQVLHDGRTIYGRISSKEGVIEVSKDICDYQQKITLMHEVIHGICNHRNIEKHIPAERYEDVTDELAKGLVQVLNDNPELIDFIKN